MKSIFSLLILVCFAGSLYGQEISISAVHSSSHFKRYIVGYGYEAGYNQSLKSGNRFDISFSQTFFSQPYNDIYSSLEDGVSTYIRQVEPHNQRLVLRIGYAFRLVDHPKSRLYIGPEAGLNYFIIREDYQRFANEFISAGWFTSDNTSGPKIGAGFLMEFELCNILSEHISASLTVNPEVTNYEKLGMLGSYDPYFIGWLNVQFGFRYLLTGEK